MREMGFQKGDCAEDGTLGPPHDMPTRYHCTAGTCLMECTSRAIRRHQKYQCHRGSETRPATRVYSKQDLAHVSGLRHACMSQMIFHRESPNLLHRIPTTYLHITPTSQSLGHIHPDKTPSQTIHIQHYGKSYTQNDVTQCPSWRSVARKP
jgi:hypothetical protein